jgi:serine phosphatase RsbU (regulator of sigma subunit)
MNKRIVQYFWSILLGVLFFPGIIHSQILPVDSAVFQLSSLSDSVISQSLNDSAKKYRAYDFDACFEYASKASEYAKKSGSKKQEGRAYNYCGNAKHRDGKLPEALQYYIAAEKVFREAGNNQGIASVNINLGMVNQDMGNHSAAIHYNRKALNIAYASGDSTNMASALNNIGTNYSDLHNLDSSLFYAFKSLEIRRKLNMELGTTLGNIGSIYHGKKQFEKALEFQVQAYQYDSVNNNIGSMCVAMSNIGATLMDMNRMSEAKEILLRGYALADSIGYRQMQLDLTSNLIAVSERTGNLQDAVNYSHQYVALKDSIANEETRNAYAEMQTRLEVAEHKNEINLLQKQNALDAEKVQKQRILIWLGAGVLVLILGLAILTYRGYRQKKRANEIISLQKDEVELQKEIIQEKNKSIIDSINYAQRIQHAILLPEEALRQSFVDAFILFKPKDIVSGDFYWFAESEQNKILVLADCTGHGVPGGFMSMLGFEILQDVVLQESVHNTSEALKRLDQKVTDTLNRNDKSYRDGMDMAMCAFRKNTNAIEFAGANRPMIVISKGELKTYKPNKNTIGGAIDETEKIFTHEEVIVSTGDMIYLFSDGYADQFGGPEGKKLKTRNLEELLLQIHTLPAHQQRQELNTRFENWRGSLEQVDDVCIIGIRV